MSWQYCIQCGKNQTGAADGLCFGCAKENYRDHQKIEILIKEGRVGGCSCKTCLHVYDNSSKDTFEKEGQVSNYNGCSLGMIPPFPYDSIDLSTIRCFIFRAKDEKNEHIW